MVKKLGLAVVLQSQRRLQDYKNYIHPKQGFKHEKINELKNKIKDFSDIECFMVIFDEMKIQENLVWPKHTGDLIGFVDLGDVNPFMKKKQLYPLH